MKNNILYILVALIIGTGVYSCSEESMKDYSVFDNAYYSPETAFDLWIKEHYNIPYNINVLYKWEDTETNMLYDVVPAEVDKVYQLLNIILYCWLDAYSEVAGTEFMKKFAPRQIFTVGTKAWKSNGTYTMGTAEGGLKITLYDVNSLKIQRSLLNDRFLWVMHHEFGHILHQTIEYPNEFEEISRDDYLGDYWSNYPKSQANPLGFISQYSRNNAHDDFVELLAYFIMYTQEELDALLAASDVSVGGRPTGKSILEKKLVILIDYMITEWNIDLYQLREVYQRRLGDIEYLDLDYNKLINGEE